MLGTAGMVEYYGWCNQLLSHEQTRAPETNHCYLAAVVVLALRPPGGAATE